jgi:hypothetical protein
MQNYHDYNLRDLFLWDRHPKGEIGIEIEMEGGPWPDVAITNWIATPDHSLRNNGIEYIIRQPINRDRVEGALTTLRDGLRGARIDFSYRTSVHVHVNVQDMSVRQWCNFVALFTTLEELLVDQVGPNRAGNKFCLRMKDADEPLMAIVEGLKAGRLPGFMRDDLKYGSMNLRATATHGTLEFRAMEGNLDVNRINTWVQTLCAIKDAAMKIEDPRSIPQDLSRLGPAEWVMSIIGDTPLSRAIVASPALFESIYEGVRLAQDVCYAVDWSRKEAPKVQEPPRGYMINDFEVGPGVILQAPIRGRIRRNPFEDVLEAQLQELRDL